MRRRRQRLTAAGIVAMLILAIFAFGAVDYGTKRHIDREIAKQPRIAFTLPPMKPVVMAQVDTQTDDLPDLLPIKEQFPDYDNVPKPLNPDDGNNADQGEPEAGSDESKMVILDDLRAAPPKSMFINAIFENTDSDLELDETVVYLSDDFTDPYVELFGRPHDDMMNNPPIPEPGTGLLVSLGLTAIAGWRRLESRRSPVARSTRTRGAEGHST